MSNTDLPKEIQDKGFQWNDKEKAFYAWLKDRFEIDICDASFIAQSLKEMKDANSASLNGEVYVPVSVERKPQKEGRYGVIRKDGTISSAYWYCGVKAFSGEQNITHWLEKITLPKDNGQGSQPEVENAMFDAIGYSVKRNK
jgi:hypothetical protein